MPLDILQGDNLKREIDFFVQQHGLKEEISDCLYQEILYWQSNKTWSISWRVQQINHLLQDMLIRIMLDFKNKNVEQRIAELISFAETFTCGEIYKRGKKHIPAKSKILKWLDIYDVDNFRTKCKELSGKDLNHFEANYEDFIYLLHKLVNIRGHIYVCQLKKIIQERILK